MSAGASLTPEPGLAEALAALRTRRPWVRAGQVVVPWETWCRTRTFHKESVETYCGRSVKEPQCWDKTKTPRRVCKECHRAVSMEATP